MRKFAAAALMAGCLGLALPARAQEALKIGYLTDMNGVAASIDGPGGVDAAQMAIEDFGGKVLGRPVQLMSADHQNRTDVGLSIARNWLDNDHVAAILDADFTPVALGVEEMTRPENKNRVALLQVGTSDVTGAKCSPNAAQWSLDAYAETHAPSVAITEAGGKTWFYVTVNYGFGISLEDESRAAVLASGGSVVGAVRHPYGASDMASYVLQAKASGAQVIGLANAVADLVNFVKQARDFGLTTPGHNPLVAFTTYEPDIQAIGLEMAQGLRTSAAFYWDRDDASRAWAQRYYARNKKMPTSLQAGGYSMTMNYLRAVQAAGSDDTAAVMRKLKELRIHDPMIRDGWVRADGRVMYDLSTIAVKSPAESTGPWDIYKIVGSIPAAQAFSPPEKSACPLMRH